MYALAVIGLVLLLGGLAAHRRATVLILDRWQTLRPREWAVTMRPVRRAFPFNSIVRSRVAREKFGVWQWSMPEWANGDAIAQRLFRQLRVAPLIALAGAFLVLLTLVKT